MLTVNTERWQQDAESLREQGHRAEHQRTRERFMALYEIAQGDNATQVGLNTTRNPQTVMAWVHRYNQLGPKAMRYRRSGGHPPL